MALTGIAPILTQQFTISPIAGQLSLSGSAPLLTFGILTPGVGSLVFNGYAWQGGESNPDSLLTGFGPMRTLRLWF